MAVCRADTAHASKLVYRVNPLEDIDTVRNLQLVLKEGRVVSDKWG